MTVARALRGASQRLRVVALQHQLHLHADVGNVTSSASLVRPEIIVRPDFARAADLGVTAQAIADTVRVATS